MESCRNKELCCSCVDGSLRTCSVWFSTFRRPSISELPPPTVLRQTSPTPSAGLCQIKPRDLLIKRCPPSICFRVYRSHVKWGSVGEFLLRCFISRVLWTSLSLQLSSSVRVLTDQQPAVHHQSARGTGCWVSCHRPSLSTVRAAFSGIAHLNISCFCLFFPLCGGIGTAK